MRKKEAMAAQCVKYQMIVTFQPSIDIGRKMSRNGDLYSIVRGGKDANSKKTQTF